MNLINLRIDPALPSDLDGICQLEAQTWGNLALGRVAIRHALRAADEQPTKRPPLADHEGRPAQARAFVAYQPAEPFSDQPGPVAWALYFETSLAAHFERLTVANTAAANTDAQFLTALVDSFVGQKAATIWQAGFDHHAGRDPDDSLLTGLDFRPSLASNYAFGPGRRGILWAKPGDSGLSADKIADLAFRPDLGRLR